jgi:hypothetical protein
MQWLESLVDYLEQNGDHETMQKLSILYPHIDLELQSVRTGLSEIMSYDPSIYNEHTYARQILKHNIRDNLASYQNLRIPIMTFRSGIRKVTEKSIPIEVQLLYDLYFHDPDTRLRIYPLSFYKKLHSKNSNVLREVIIKSVVYTNLVTFTPICFTIKHDVREKKNIWVNCLCYMDVIVSSTLENSDRRYVVFTFDLPSVPPAEMHENKLLEIVNDKNVQYRDSDIDLTFFDIVSGVRKVLKEYSKNF